MIPLYAALPVGALTKLYAFRWIMVGLSLVTLWLTWRMVLELFPGNIGLAASASLLLALLPERVAAVSRLSNDVLLELVATAFVWLCTRTMLRGMSTRRSQLLGLLLGLGVLTKTSMIFLAVLLPFVFLVNRRSSRLGLHAMWAGGIAFALAAPLVARNLVLYGDPSGFSGFELVYRIPRPLRNWGTVGSAVWDLFRHAWLVWWKGGKAQSNPLLTGIYVLLLGACAASAYGLVRFWRSEKGEGKQTLQYWVLVAYALAGAAFALTVLASYFAGLFPIIQGRFYLPVIAPLAILFTRGLQLLPRGTTLLAGTLLLLAGLNALALFGNLLPYFYFWSAEASRTEFGSFSWQTLKAVWTISFPRWLNDKPAIVRTLSALLLPAYAFTAALTATVYARVHSAHELPTNYLDSNADLAR
jgi:hypothetical protein